MFLRFSAFAAVLLNVSSLPEVASALNVAQTKHQEQEHRELQQSCAERIAAIQFPTTSGTTVFWVNGGGTDREWINTDNWQYDYLPGVHRFNKLIMAVNDVATVHCDATYMHVVPSLEARSGATLDATADLNLDQLLLKTNAVVTQSSTSSLTIAKNLYLAASYSIADQAQLSIGLDLYMASNAKLTITGEGSSITASDVTTSLSQIHGEVKYVLGLGGTGSFDLKGGLLIGSTTAKLIVDATSYTGSGAASIPLIKYTSVTGAFSAANIIISGLAPDVVAQVESKSDGLYLELSGGGPVDPTPLPTKTPTHSPVTPVPTTPAPITPGPTTPAPITGSPIVSPVTPAPVTPGPTGNPITPAPTPSPVTGSPIASPVTPAPVTPGPTSNPITPAPTPESTPQPTDHPVSDSVTRIVLTEGGYDPITSTGTCPPHETTSIVIDGKDYTGGPGLISLYECSGIIDASYDLINIRLENFVEGLWFELSFKSDTVDLVIKSLANYKEYWNHVRTSYVVGEYPEQEHTEHFPEFSWNTVPTWTRFRKNANVVANPQPWNYNAGPWTDDEIKSIAENNFLSWYGLNTPEHVIDTWERIKDVNDTHKTLYYWNAESFWGTDGIGLQQEFLRDGVVGTGGRKLYDHTNPAMQAWWVAHGLEMSQQASSDGVFTDNSISRECDNAQCDLELTDKSLMVRKLAEDVPDNVLDIGNYLRQMIDDGNRFRMPYVDGSYFENTHFSVSLTMITPCRSMLSFCH